MGRSDGTSTCMWRPMAGTGARAASHPASFPAPPRCAALSLREVSPSPALASPWPASPRLLASVAWAALPGAPAGTTVIPAASREVRSLCHPAHARSAAVACTGARSDDTGAMRRGERRPCFTRRAASRPSARPSSSPLPRRLRPRIQRTGFPNAWGSVTSSGLGSSSPSSCPSVRGVGSSRMPWCSRMPHSSPSRSHVMRLPALRCGSTWGTRGGGRTSPPSRPTRSFSTRYSVTGAPSGAGAAHASEMPNRPTRTTRGAPSGASGHAAMQQQSQGKGVGWDSWGPSRQRPGRKGAIGRRNRTFRPLHTRGLRPLGPPQLGAYTCAKFVEAAGKEGVAGENARLARFHRTAPWRCRRNCLAVGRVVPLGVIQHGARRVHTAILGCGRRFRHTRLPHAHRHSGDAGAAIFPRIYAHVHSRGPRRDHMRRRRCGRLDGWARGLGVSGRRGTRGTATVRALRTSRARRAAPRSPVSEALRVARPHPRRVVAAGLEATCGDNA